MSAKNVLVQYGTGGLGDLLIITPFFKDFAQQHPDKKLYFHFKYPFIRDRYIQVFDNNPYFHLYTNDFNPDILVDFNWSDKDNELEQKRFSDKTAKYIDNFYHEFSRRSGLNVARTMSYVDMYLSDSEKAEVQAMISNKKKPICLVNDGYHPIYTTTRNWGWPNFQRVINLLHDKIDFVQFGDRKAGFFHGKLLNCVDALDKTNIRDLFKMVMASDFMLSNDSSPYHIASVNALYCKRTVVTVLGGKSCYEWLNCYSPENVSYELLYNNDKFANCYESGKYCCDIGNVYATSAGFTSVCDTRLCKCPTVNCVGQLMASCFACISPEEVAARIEKHL